MTYIIITFIVFHKRHIIHTYTAERAVGEITLGNLPLSAVRSGLRSFWALAVPLPRACSQPCHSCCCALTIILQTLVHCWFVLDLLVQLQVALGNPCSPCFWFGFQGLGSSDLVLFGLWFSFSVLVWILDEICWFWEFWLAQLLLRFLVLSACGFVLCFCFVDPFDFALPSVASGIVPLPFFSFGALVFWWVLSFVCGPFLSFSIFCLVLWFHCRSRFWRLRCLNRSIPDLTLTWMLWLLLNVLLCRLWHNRMHSQRWIFRLNHWH